jgi:hypothetical protein
MRISWRRWTVIVIGEIVAMVALTALRRRWLPSLPDWSPLVIAAIAGSATIGWVTGTGRFGTTPFYDRAGHLIYPGGAAIDRSEGRRTLEVHRDDNAGLFRRIAVSIDGVTACRLQHHETAIVEIGAGIHQVQASIDWLQSTELEVDVPDGATTRLTTTSSVPPLQFTLLRLALHRPVPPRLALTHRMTDRPRRATGSETP